MDILILDCNLQVSDLLQTLVSGLTSRALFRSFDSPQNAMASWQRYPADMAITEWDLPDGKGLELVRQ
jgi:two-component SAPR family response regulator